MTLNVDLQPELISKAIAWRRHLHANPELAYLETRTADFVSERLGAIGLQVHRGLGGTGVVGTLTRGTSGRTIGLRADMDALPIEEQGCAAHASRTRGVMHACGHDGHVAMLLAAAFALSTRDDFKGTVHFIFQPAEEGAGGAKRMIDDGLFRLFPCDAIYALHNWPDLPVGTIAASPGPVMAASDKFEIVMEGRGGHAGWPHLAQDVLLSASQLVGQLHAAVSRRVPAARSAVLSVTRLSAGETHNVLPARALLAGTVRSFDDDVQDVIETTIRQATAGAALAAGVTAKVAYDRYYPATVNDPEAARFVCAVASELGRAVAKVEPSMGAEDFSFMLRETPGCYFWLGAGRSGDNPGLHSPAFDFNDDALPIGVAFWVALVLRGLAAETGAP